eukprot:CCRYP_002241-RA/>CCRYP_002241-RA protein AED:0.04 eAED:0.02 QI:17/0/0/1/0/0/2/0/404
MAFHKPSLLAKPTARKDSTNRGYFKSKLVPWLWHHNKRRIQFTLVVGDFGVKYERKEGCRPLAVSPSGTLHCQSRLGRHPLHWYSSSLGLRATQSSSPHAGRSSKALTQFQHVLKKNNNNLFPTHLSLRPNNNSPNRPPTALLSQEQDKNSSKSLGKFLFLGPGGGQHSVNSYQCISITISTTNNRHNETDTTAAGLLGDSRAGCSHLLSQQDDPHPNPKPEAELAATFSLDNSSIPPNNGAIFNIAHIIKRVMSSATEAELAALYINYEKRLHQNNLGRNGAQTTSHSHANRQCHGEAVINAKVQPKRTKAMDMRFHWLQNRGPAPVPFLLAPGKSNLADYWTKHHTAAHHVNVRHDYLTLHIVLEMLRMSNAAARGIVGTLLSHHHMASPLSSTSACKGVMI